MKEKFIDQEPAKNAPIPNDEKQRAIPSANPVTKNLKHQHTSLYTARHAERAESLRGEGVTSWRLLEVGCTIHFDIEPKIIHCGVLRR